MSDQYADIRAYLTKQAYQAARKLATDKTAHSYITAHIRNALKMEDEIEITAGELEALWNCDRDEWGMLGSLVVEEDEVLSLRWDEDEERYFLHREEDGWFIAIEQGYHPEEIAEYEVDCGEEEGNLKALLSSIKWSAAWGVVRALHPNADEARVRDLAHNWGANAALHFLGRKDGYHLADSQTSEWVSLSNVVEQYKEWLETMTDEESDVDWSTIWADEEMQRLCAAAKDAAQALQQWRGA